jgi:hypothetical protein
VGAVSVYALVGSLGVGSREILKERSMNPLCQPWPASIPSCTYSPFPLLHSCTFPIPLLYSRGGRGRFRSHQNYWSPRPQAIPCTHQLIAEARSISTRCWLNRTRAPHTRDRRPWSCVPGYEQIVFEPPGSPLLNPTASMSTHTAHPPHSATTSRSPHTGSARFPAAAFRRHSSRRSARSAVRLRCHSGAGTDGPFHPTARSAG